MSTATEGEGWTVEGGGNDRRAFLAALGAASIAVLLPRTLSAQQGPAKAAPAKSTPAQAALPAMTVYKSATCGCCKGWVEHARKAGFTVRAIDTEDLSGVKKTLGVPAGLESCHTIVVANYLVEGHVPAEDIKRLLRERPAVRGLAVPGMPMGSPGMDLGDPKDFQRYEVVAFTAAGVRSVFARH